VVGRQKADIDDTLHLKDVAVATTLAFYIWGAHWRHLANTTEPSMCGGDSYPVSPSFSRTKYNDHAEDEKFRGCWPSHLEQFTSRSANCNSLPSDVRSTFEGPPVWLIGSASEDYL